MALTDLNSTSPAFDPRSFRDSIPHEALARLRCMARPGATCICRNSWPARRSYASP